MYEAQLSICNTFSDSHHRCPHVTDDGKGVTCDTGQWSLNMWRFYTVIYWRGYCGYSSAAQRTCYTFRCHISKSPYIIYYLSNVGKSSKLSLCHKNVLQVRPSHSVQVYDHLCRCWQLHRGWVGSLLFLSSYRWARSWCWRWCPWLSPPPRMLGILRAELTPAGRRDIIWTNPSWRPWRPSRSRWPALRLVQLCPPFFLLLSQNA